MKTTMISRVLLVLAVAGSSAVARAAAPIGNPARTVGAGRFAIGVEGNSSVLDLKTDGTPTIQTTYQGNTVTTPLSLQTRELKGEYEQVMLKVEYGVLPWLDVWAKGGVARIKQSCSKWNQATLIGFYDAQSEFEPAWAVGTKVRLYHSDNDLSVGIAAQFSQYFNKKFDLMVEAAGSQFKPMPIDSGLFPVVTTPITGSSLESRTRVYQLALGASQKIEALNVYGGAQYSLMKNNYTNDVWGTGASGLERRKEPNNKLMSDRALGLFMGLEYTLFDRITLGVESRLGNETGVSGSISYEL